jgi:thioredoxin-dependent peroxiredoxin
MHLVAGSGAPSFETTDFLGDPIRLSELRGRPVLLSFYRYAACPVCNLRISSMIRAYPQWSAGGLAVLAVFQSPPEAIGQYVGRQDVPFPLIPDPEMDIYRKYGVQAKWRGLLSLRVMVTALKAFGKGFLPGRVDGPFQRLPADFLIDADGRIAIAYYGEHIDDHVPIAMISEWLDRWQTRIEAA